MKPMSAVAAVLVCSVLALAFAGVALAAAPAGEGGSTVAPAEKPATGTVVGKVVDPKGQPVENAKVYLNIRKPTRDSNMTRVAEGTTAADGTFSIDVAAHDDIVINVFAPNSPLIYGKGGVKVKAGEKTDLGEIKLAMMQM